MSQTPTLDILNDIQSAALNNAAPLPPRETARLDWQGVGFQVGGLRLVSPLGEVSEVLTLPRLASLPGVKSWVLGVANVRGRLIPIVDLHEFLGLTSTLPRAQWRVLVVEDEDLIAGFVVEQSLGIHHFLEEAIDEADMHVHASIKPYTRGVFRDGGQVFFEAHLKLILRDDRFFDVAERTEQKG